MASCGRNVIARLGIGLVALTPGCGIVKPSISISIPSFVSVLKATLPGGLVPGAVAIQYQSPSSGTQVRINTATFTPTDSMILATQYINNMFQNYWPTVTGNTVEGFLISLLSTLDESGALFNGANSQNHACLNSSGSSYTLDFSALNPVNKSSPNMLTFSFANLQCTGIFTGASGSAGISGEAFGRSGNTVSQWITLGDSAGDAIGVGGAFIEMANLANAGSTSTLFPQTLDGLVMNYEGSSSSLEGRFFILRYKANATTGTLELYFASNSANVGGTDGSSNPGGPTYLGPGVRLISDGNNIYADGLLCTDSQGTSCSITSTVSNGGGAISGGKWSLFQVCLEAKTLTIVDPVTTTNCLTLANSFTLNSNATPYLASSGVFAGLGPFSQDLLTFSNITGDNTVSDTNHTILPSLATLTSTQLTTLTNLYSISNAMSVAPHF